MSYDFAKRIDLIERLAVALALKTRDGYTGMLDKDIESLLEELKELRSPKPFEPELPVPFGRLSGS